MAEPLLGRDDLDDLSDSVAGADDPATVAAQLVEAATAGRLADPADAGYAYLLAAELHERVDDLAGALALTERALGAYRATGGDRESGRPRTYRARLLLQLGREREAMAELAALRPMMITDEAVAAAVPEALEAGGRADLALEWLTEALAQLPREDGNGLVSEQLTSTRDRIRAGLAASPDLDGEDDLAPDPADDFADLLLDGDAGADALAVGSDAVLLVWPQDAYEQVDQRWPEVLEATGAESWDEYRRYCQALIAGWRHPASLLLVTGDPEEFAEWLTEQGADPFRTNLVAQARAYGDYLAEQGDPVELPPAAGDPCWCGSGVSYSGCCRRLSPP